MWQRIVYEAFQCFNVDTKEKTVALCKIEVRLRLSCTSLTQQSESDSIHSPEKFNSRPAEKAHK